MEKRQGSMGGVEMRWTDKIVLVTGPTGFVGSWLIKALVARGANVVALARDILPEAEMETLISQKPRAIVRGDIRDQALVERCMNEYEVEWCYHLAAQTIVGAANNSPLGTFDTNIRGTWNVLESARNSKTLKGLLLASSDKAYGEHKELPYRENYCLRGLNPYDTSKACADILAQCYHHTYGLPIAIARCANIYGGGDLNFSRIVPGTIRSLIRGESPIIRSDGTPIRDYLYIEDAVEGYLALAEKFEKAKGEGFNFGTNSPISVHKLVDTIIQLFGADLKPTVLGTGKMKGEIHEQYLSSERAEKALGWKPKYSLEDGLRETIAWYREHLK